MGYFENKDGSPQQKFFIRQSGYAKKLDQHAHRRDIFVNHGSDRNRPRVGYILHGKMSWMHPRYKPVLLV